MKSRRVPWVFILVFVLLAVAACTFQAVTPEPVYSTQQGEGSRGLGDTNFTNVVAAGWYQAGNRSALTVTNGGTITALGTYQPLTSSGTVTATLAAGAAGRVLVLINTANTTINIQDTGIQKLSAAAALGQYDSLVLWSDGTNWIEIARSNN